MKQNHLIRLVGTMHVVTTASPAVKSGRGLEHRLQSVIQRAALYV